MQNPFEQISISKRRRVFWALVVLTLLVAVVMQIAGAPLKTGAAPAGIVSFEFAATTTGAERILASWDSMARAYAAFVQGFDFLFIPLYASTIALGAVMAADTFARKHWRLSASGRWLAWGLLLAGLFDVVENIALLMILFVTPAYPWPQISAWCAAPKFALILLGLLYVLFGGLIYLFARPTADN